MRRTYRVTKAVAPAGELNIAEWKRKRAELVELLKLGPVEVDLSYSSRFSKFQLQTLLRGIHLDAKIKPEHLTVVLTFKHPDSTVCDLANRVYWDGIYPESARE